MAALLDLGLQSTSAETRHHSERSVGTEMAGMRNLRYVRLICFNRCRNRLIVCVLVVVCLGIVVNFPFLTWRIGQANHKHKRTDNSLVSGNTTQLEEHTFWTSWLERSLDYELQKTRQPVTGNSKINYNDGYVTTYFVQKTLETKSLATRQSATIRPKTVNRSAYKRPNTIHSTFKRSSAKTKSQTNQTTVYWSNPADYRRQKTETDSSSTMIRTKVKEGNNGTHYTLSRIMNVANTEHTKVISESDEEIERRQIFLSFQSALTESERGIYQLLMREFNDLAMKNNLTYFLCDGSLLGSYRHHGMIPWDDDVDVMWNNSLKQDIKLAFRDHPSLALDTSSDLRWKVYLETHSWPIEDIPWKWPFLDCIFFKENRTHLWDADSDYIYSIFEKTMIFPTTVRPFLIAWYPAPRETEKILERAYNISLCLSKIYSHKFESAQTLHVPTPISIPCSYLHGKVSFVERQERNSSTIEILKIGEKTIHTFVLKNT